MEQAAPERLHTLKTEGKPEPLEETPSSTEGRLQKLIADHPDLLDGVQIRPGDARRRILVVPKKGIAASSGGNARWSMNHLIVDRDAVPTLVEVKRAANREIRRAIVGQMLDYAAHAAETWTADELRALVDQWTDGFDRDDFAERVFSKGVKAWAVRDAAATRHAGDPMKRLRRVTEQPASL